MSRAVLEASEAVLSLQAPYGACTLSPGTGSHKAGAWGLCAAVGRASSPLNHRDGRLQQRTSRTSGTCRRAMAAIGHGARTAVLQGARHVVMTLSGIMRKDAMYSDAVRVHEELDLKLKVRWAS